MGLANCRIHVFSAKTGVLSRTLTGHEQGVWAVNLVSRGGHWGGGAMRSDRKGKGRRWKDGDGNNSIYGSDVMASLSSRLSSMSIPLQPLGLDHLLLPPCALPSVWMRIQMAFPPTMVRLPTTHPMMTVGKRGRIRENAAMSVARRKDGVNQMH